MTYQGHDRYDNDLLKEIKKLNTNLEKIAKALTKDEGIKLEVGKSLYEQGVDSCLTCKLYYSCGDGNKGPNTCCTFYEEND